MTQFIEVASRDRWKKLGVAVGLLAPPLLLFISLIGLSDAALDGDSALLELGVRLTARGENLLGPYSRFHFHHLGPALFHLLSPLYFLLGQRHGSLLLSAVLLNAVALWIIYRVVRPRRWTLALAVGLLTSLLLASRMDRLFSFWNPDIPLLPFAAALFSFAAAAAGRKAYLLTALLLATFAVQSHLAYTIPAASAGLATGLAILFPRVVGRTNEPRMSWRSAAGLVVLPALWWLPPLYEEFSRDNGNISQLVAFFTLPHLGISARSTMEVLGSRLTDFLCGPLGATPVVAWVSGALVLTLPAAYYQSRRRGDALASSLSLVSLAGLAGAAFSISRIVGPLYGHLVAWVSTLGLVGCSALVLSFCRVAETGGWKSSGRNLLAWSLVPLFLASTLLNLRTVGVPLFLLQGWTETPEYRRLADFAAATNLALKENRVTLPEARVATADCWPAMAMTLLRLDKKSVRFCVEDAWLFQYSTALACRRFEGHPGRRDLERRGLLIFGDRRFQTRVQGDARFRPVAEWDDCAAFLSWNPPPPEVIDFSGPESTLYLSSGFAPLEELESKAGRWSIGGSSTLAVPLQPESGYELEIVARPQPIPGRTQTIRVVLNGSPITSFPLADGERSYRIQLPAEKVAEVNELRFDYAYAQPPMLHEKGSGDWRPLGVFFRRLRFSKTAGS